MKCLAIEVTDDVSEASEEVDDEDAAVSRLL
jgi:hypothetical protein